MTFSTEKRAVSEIFMGTSVSDKKMKNALAFWNSLMALIRKKQSLNWKEIRVDLLKKFWS